MSRYAYADSFYPPGPVLPVRLGPPDVGSQVSLEGLVDTGADRTVVPPALADELMLPLLRLTDVFGPDRVRHRVPVWAAAIEVEERVEIYEVIGLGTEFLLGRDVLESLIIELHGPRQSLDVTT